MRIRILIVALVVGVGSVLAENAPPILTSIGEVNALSKPQVHQRPFADFVAVVTYHRSYEHTLFVQDGKNAIYVAWQGPLSFTPGDRLRIRGKVTESFRPIISASEVQLLDHGGRVSPVRVTYSDLSNGRLDGTLVRVQALLKSADLSLSSDRPETRLNLSVEGSPVEAHVDDGEPQKLAGLLDARVEVTGVASGRFDGKMQMTGIVFHVQSMSDVRLLQKPLADPWTLPLTPSEMLFSAFRHNNQADRVHVQGVITYYYPGSAVVLQDGNRSLWINTHSREELRVGDRADATGYPDAHDGFLRLSDGEVRDTHRFVGVDPAPASWLDLAQSKHVFEIVSIEGKVVAEVREAARDTYVLNSEGHLFSAVNRHAEQRVLRAVPLPPLKQIPIGAKVRAVGICIVEDSNPYNGAVPVDLLLRNSDDLAVIARPSGLNVANLVRVISVLLLLMLFVLGWLWTLRHKVREQTQIIAQKAAYEAQLERCNAQSEQRRSQILEHINGARPIDETLAEITELVSFQSNGAPCWCEIDEAQPTQHFGGEQPDAVGQHIVHHRVFGRSGSPLGALYAAVDDSQGRADQMLALSNGASLVALAIETRRVYKDLVHRSEFDVLTDVHNRFSLEKRLDAAIARARETGAVFGLAFVDLDEFKQVNDTYGHRIGDLYLQEVAGRMKHHLRNTDLLARIGGDEFAVLVPSAFCRSDVEDVCDRLVHCFDQPFTVGNHLIRGAASIGMAIYPEDGSSHESLLSAADAAMYIAKKARRAVKYSSLVAS